MVHSSHFLCVNKIIINIYFGNQFYSIDCILYIFAIFQWFICVNLQLTKKYVEKGGIEIKPKLDTKKEIDQLLRIKKITKKKKKKKKKKQKKLANKL